MSGRSPRSARVVIMDDVSWSEPAPRGRRADAELNPPEWMQSPADDLLDAELGATVDRWRTESSAEPDVIEYAGDVDAEQIWGPRPKLMAEEPGGRRTVVITGRVADQHVVARTGPRSGGPLHARHGFAADRTAMWAVLLCVILLLVAVTSH